MLTAYDYPTALHADQAGVDISLVGDSLSMVCLGNRTTQSATVDEMIHHARAARRATQSALFVADLPFGSYETSTSKAIETAVRFIKEADVDAVKLEGGVSRAPIIRAIVDAGIAVMGHVGLLPQAVSRAGAFRAVGRSVKDAQDVIHDALAVQDAGAFAVVVECIPARVAELVTSAVSIPTIGIGSGPACDGQVLVYHDMLGINNHPHHENVAPKFVKKFANLGPVIDEAIRNYCQQVRNRDFPSARYSPYRIPDDQYEDLRAYVNTLKETKTQNNSKAGPSNIDRNPQDSSDESIRLY